MSDLYYIEDTLKTLASGIGRGGDPNVIWMSSRTGKGWEGWCTPLLAEAKVYSLDEAIDMCDRNPRRRMWSVKLVEEAATKRVSLKDVKKEAIIEYGSMVYRCPYCKAPPGIGCKTAKGVEREEVHTARVGAGYHEP